MYVIGDVNTFAIKLDEKNSRERELQLIVKNKDILQYQKDDKLLRYEWDLEDIVEWFETNLESIQFEDDYPVPVEGSSGVELYRNSFDFDTEDDEKFDEWYDKVQEWSFKHSWFSARAGSFLADVYFRKIKDQIEISWDNNGLFDNITFIQSSGVYRIETKMFKKVIERFISIYRDKN